MYSSYEFFFDDHSDKLYAIQNDHLEADCSNHADLIQFKSDLFEIDTWFIETGKALTYGDVKELLKLENVRFIEKEQYERPHLFFDTGVYLDFAKDEGGFYLEGEEWHQIPPKKYDSIEGWPLIGIRYFPSDW